jgi:hypothetical protein
VLAIAAHIPSSEIGLGYFQETHPQELFKECSHFVELVTNPAQMPEVLHRAMRALDEFEGCFATSLAVVRVSGTSCVGHGARDVPQRVSSRLVPPFRGSRDSNSRFRGPGTPWPSARGPAAVKAATRSVARC